MVCVQHDPVRAVHEPAAVRGARGAGARAPRMRGRARTAAGRERRVPARAPRARARLLGHGSRRAAALLRDRAASPFQGTQFSRM